MATHHGELGSPVMAKSMLANAGYTGIQAMSGATFINSAARNTRTAENFDYQKLLALAQATPAPPPPPPSRQPQPKEKPMPNRRIVQVYIADPSDDVPLADAILYSGDQKMTDLTDQELFFEIDIRAVLETHNAKRTKIINKKIKDRTEYLEPAKVRDLKMVVVDVASF